MGWTRNYYNALTALLLGDTTETSVNTPVDYQPPIVYRHATGNYSNSCGSDLTAGDRGQLENPYRSGMQHGIMRLGQLGFLVFSSYTGTPPQYRTPAYPDLAIQLGAGDTPSTYEDYKLDDPIWTGYTMVNSSGTLTAPSAFDAVTHKYSSTRTFTINNSSADAFTIKEFGIFAGDVLLYREVLNSPITLDPGESVTIDFTREAEVFNYTPYT